MRQEPDDKKLGDVDKMINQPTLNYTEISVSKQSSDEKRALLQIKINDSDAMIASGNLS